MHRATFEHHLTRHSSRRQFVAGGLAASVGVSFRGHPTHRGVAAQPEAPVASRSMHPFTLGVASGDPTSDGVVIWTRLAPLPLEGGGMGETSVQVAWEVAIDDQFRSIVRAGTTSTSAELAHSIHVDLEGLAPGHEYFYRFLAGEWGSPTGRTRTAPLQGQPLDRLRFGFASCANWEHGYFSAYRDLSRQEIDFTVFLGDYLYEYPPGSDYLAANSETVRLHTPGEARDLASYRNRHAQYKTDPDLQLAHQRSPWIVTWDDHEVHDDYAGANGQAGTLGTGFLARRSDAYQAFYEHMPLRPESMPHGPHMQLYRGLQFGDLASFHILDTRQYRTEQPCTTGIGTRCAESFDRNATLLGAGQETWLLERLANGDARWNVLAQQVMMGELAARFFSEPVFNLDQWDGYPLARNRLLGAVEQLSLANVVVLSGDVHSAWVHDLKADFDRDRARTVATEFVSTSISARNPVGAPLALTLPGNSHVRFLDLRHGYTLCDIQRDHWLTTFRATQSAEEQQADYQDIAAFVVEHGRAGAVPA